MAKEQLTDEEKALRAKLRGETIGAPAVHVSKIIEWREQQYEIRAPSMALQKRIDQLSQLKDGSRDNLKALFVAIIGCVFVPGTNIQVFEAADEANMLERGSKDFVGVFANALADLAKEATFEGAEKTPSASG